MLELGEFQLGDVTIRCGVSHLLPLGMMKLCTPEEVLRLAELERQVDRVRELMEMERAARDATKGEKP